MAFANTYVHILARQGDAVRAAQLLGAEEAMHERLDIPNPFRDEELDEALAHVGDALSSEEWERHRRAGRLRRVEDLLGELAPG